MSTPNEQDQAFIALPDLALRTLTADDAVRLMDIVQTSERLQRELASLRGAVGALGYSAPLAQVPAEERRKLRERLVSRAAAYVNAGLRDSGGATASRPAAPSANPGGQVRHRTGERQPIGAGAPATTSQ